MHDLAMRWCLHCGSRRPERYGTNGAGDLVDVTPPCLCPGGRKEAGICRDCLNPVEGAVGKALRCGRHKREAQNAAARRWRQRNPDKVRAIQEARAARLRTPEGRVQRRLYERELRSRPEVKGRRRQQRRRDALKHPERKAEYNRRYKERHPEGVREQQRRANAKRREANRQYMHRYCTKYVGSGCSPTCRKCGRNIPYSGRGRPHLECQRCDPQRWKRDRRRTEAPE